MKRLICLIFTAVAIMCFSGGVMAADYVYCASVNGEMSLHISPDDESFVVTVVPACSKLKLIDTEQTWGLVEFDNKSGWINLSFTRTSYAKAAEATGNDAVSSVKVNSKSGKTVLYNVPTDAIALGSEEKYTIPNGTILKVTRETQSGWGLVSMNGKYAWIQMKNTVPHEVEADADRYGIYYVYVLSDGGKGLELWETAGGKNLCAVIPDCIKLTVREEKGNFAYVSYDGINGWIDLRYTAESLANAQSNAGTAVNVEYTVDPSDGAESVDLLSVPSSNPNDGGSVVATIEKGVAVFGLRSTLGGWTLVNYEGVLGWIPPETLSVSETLHKDITQVLDSPYTGYISSTEKKGLKIYARPDEEAAVATIPEFTQIQVIAEKDGYEYICCDYAAGWTKKGAIALSQEDAFADFTSEKKGHYMTECETLFMSLPTENELCQSTVLSVLSENTYFHSSHLVTTGKQKWAYAEIDGKCGWVKLSDAQKVLSPFVMLILAVAIVLVIGAVIYAVIYIIKKKKSQHNKSEGDSSNENGEELSDEGSGSGERAADVSCER